MSEGIKSGVNCILEKESSSAFDIEDTIKGFKMILDGEVDEYPEAAFNLVGTIEEAIEKGRKLLDESK